MVLVTDIDQTSRMAQGVSFEMRGNEVFKMAVNTLGRIVDETLDANNMKKSDIDWLVPHQANIQDNYCYRQEIENVDGAGCRDGKQTRQYIGSIGTALALDVAVTRRPYQEKRAALLLEAFGGGFTWGSGTAAVLNSLPVRQSAIAD